jgi:23S rRNA (adenine2503-C2)-methyltransferase
VEPKLEIKSLYRDELAEALSRMGEPAYRADQILQWAYERGAQSFDDMTNLPALLRGKLPEHFDLHAVHDLKARRSSDTTEKFLFQLRDGSLVETVLIPATPGLTSRSDRMTLCVSTQVGCAYACAFCASGLEGVKRNLTAAEIVDQVVHAQRLGGQPIDNIVVMGMGEPLANYDNLMRALRIINAPWGLGIGARKITVSTVGLAPEIKRLAEEPMQIRLAVSLHGATDEVRGKIMPVNKKYPLKELLAACRHYREMSGRMMTFEYILIDGVNDGLEQARKLAVIARRLGAKVNLIPYNPIEGLAWKRPEIGRCRAFRRVLEENQVRATLRMEKGTEISAACGQLRLRHEAGESEGAGRPD